MLEEMCQCFGNPKAHARPSLSLSPSLPLPPCRSRCKALSHSAAALATSRPGAGERGAAVSECLCMWQLAFTLAASCHPSWLLRMRYPFSPGTQERTCLGPGCLIQEKTRVSWFRITGSAERDYLVPLCFHCQGLRSTQGRLLSAGCFLNLTLLVDSREESLVLSHTTGSQPGPQGHPWLPRPQRGLRDEPRSL